MLPSLDFLSLKYGQCYWFKNKQNDMDKNNYIGITNLSIFKVNSRATFKRRKAKVVTSLFKSV